MLRAADLLSGDLSSDSLIGEDAVVRIIDENIAIVENVDVFTPIHDDAAIQGRIVACNATNDVFAMGVTRIISLQAFLAYPRDLPETIMAEVLRGMDDFMHEIGSEVTGGQTITNPCPVMGGICIGYAHPNEIIYSRGAKSGDAILLTKPLGIQPAMRSYRDLQDENRQNLLTEFSEEELVAMQETAVRIMTKSNLEVAQAMKDVGVHAATDVTGFGLLGHAGNVAGLSRVDIFIEQIPVIRGSIELAAFFGHELAEGYAAETAGGMLVFLDQEKADEFSHNLKRMNLPCWRIGYTSESRSTPHAVLADDAEFIEADFP